MSVFSNIKHFYRKLQQLDLKLIIFHKLSPYMYLGTVAFIVLTAFSCSKNAPPNPGTLAIFDGGAITEEEVNVFLRPHLVAKSEVADPSKSGKAEKKIASNKQSFKDIEFFKKLVRDLVLSELIDRKVKEKQLDNKANIRDTLKHSKERITLAQMDEEMHQSRKIQVDDLEVEAFYNENRTSFNNRTLEEVAPDIKAKLFLKKENQYTEEYVQRLVETSGVTKNLDLLSLMEPTEDQIRAEYNQNMVQFQEPERWVLEKIVFDERGGDLLRQAKKALALLGSGESFEATAAKFSSNRASVRIDYIPSGTDKIIFDAFPSPTQGMVSAPIELDGDYVILRLNEIIPIKQRSLESVNEEIRYQLIKNEEERLISERGNETLFTIKGKRFTFGEFFQEFKELPFAEQRSYYSENGRRELVDQMIARLVLLDDSYERMLSEKKQGVIDQDQKNILASLFHKEAIDDSLEVSDSEIKAFYMGNKTHFKTPERNQIRFIYIRGEAESDKASTRAREAYEMIKKGGSDTKIAFEEAARKYSDDAVSANNGGLLGDWIQETDDMLYEGGVHEFHKTIKALKIGRPSEPIRLGEDYYIVQVEKREEARILSLEEVREHAKQEVLAKKHEAVSEKMYEDLLKEAGFVIYSSRIRALPEKYSEYVLK
ncbi:MAG: peptidylprolyl isomerase [Rectinemataceae bacterium]|nr:peptidylprolyl isomerase [Rectinemataceae bacterium]